MMGLRGHVPVPADTAGGGAQVVVDQQLWVSPDGQVWTVTIDNTGSFQSTAVQPLTTEGGRYLTAQDGSVLITEGV